MSVKFQTVQTLDGVVLPVVQAGTRGAPVLVLVHGVASSRRVWEPLLAQPQLLERYRLVAFDLRGHGESPMPLSPTQLLNASGPSNAGAGSSRDDDPRERLSNDDTNPWVQDLDAVLKILDDFGSVHLVGWSFGSTVVQAWMHEHGGLDFVASATLISGPSVLGISNFDEAAALVPRNALTALAEAATGGESAYADLILSRGDVDHSVDARTRAVAEEDARRALPAAVAAALSYSFDYRTFLLALPVEQRARINALVCEHDQVFRASPLQALWAQAGVRSHLLDGQPHAVPLVDADLLTSKLLAQIGHFGSSRSAP